MRNVDEEMEHKVLHVDLFFLIPLNHKSIYKK